MFFILKNWSPIIATLAFLLSCWASYHTYKLTHLQPQAMVKWVNEVKSGESSQFNVCLSVFNGSSKPISIKKIELGHYHAVDFPLVLVKDENSKIYSDDLPINIEPFKSTKFIVVFQYVDPDIIRHQTAIKLIYDSDRIVIANIKPFGGTIDSREMMKRLSAYRIKK